MDTLRITRELSEASVFSHEQAERSANAFASYWHDVQDDLVTEDYLELRLAQLEARLEGKLETRRAQGQNRILASQVALFVLLAVC